MEGLVASETAEQDHYIVVLCGTLRSKMSPFQYGKGSGLGNTTVLMVYGTDLRKHANIITVLYRCG